MEFNYENERMVLYKIHYCFSRKVSEKRKEALKNEYFRLRKEAVKQLNPKFDIWNKQFKKIHIPKRDSDPLQEYGGTMYCRYIRFMEILALIPVNIKCSRHGIFVWPDIIGDISIKSIFDRTTLVVEFEPIQEIRS